MKPIRVFSAFNGMNCARIALDKLNIPIEKYYSSEIDKYAIQVTQHNHPDTVQLGDICNIKGSDLGHIDLICGGSPCQGFSMAGKMLNFDDPRSKLFFEFVRIYEELKKINPNIKFFLENVRMQKWCQDVISRYLGVYPVQINSSLVSAQNRERWYWTNINFNYKIQNKGIVLKDILSETFDEKLIINGKPKLLRARARITNINSYKCPTLLKSQQKHGTDDIIFFDSDSGIYRYPTREEAELMQNVPIGYTKSISYNNAMGCLGNGWTVDIIAHIFQGLKEDVKTNNRQFAASLF